MLKIMIERIMVMKKNLLVFLCFGLFFSIKIASGTVQTDFSAALTTASTASNIQVALNTLINNTEYLSAASTLIDYPSQSSSVYGMIGKMSFGMGLTFNPLPFGGVSIPTSISDALFQTLKDTQTLLSNPNLSNYLSSNIDSSTGLTEKNFATNFLNFVSFIIDLKNATTPSAIMAIINNSGYLSYKPNLIDTPNLYISIFTKIQSFFTNNMPNAIDKPTLTALQTLLSSANLNKFLNTTPAAGQTISEQVAATTWLTNVNAFVKTVPADLSSGATSQWSLDATSGNVWFWDGTKWNWASGDTFKQIAVTSSGIVCALSTSTATGGYSVKVRTGATTSNPFGTAWQSLAGGFLSTITASGLYIWGINSSNISFYITGIDNPSTAQWKWLNPPVLLDNTKPLTVDASGAINGTDINGSIWIITNGASSWQPLGVAALAAALNAIGTNYTIANIGASTDTWPTQQTMFAIVNSAIFNNTSFQSATGSGGIYDKIKGFYAARTASTLSAVQGLLKTATGKNFLTGVVTSGSQTLQQLDIANCLTQVNNEASFVAALANATTPSGINAIVGTSTNPSPYTSLPNLVDYPINSTGSTMFTIIQSFFTNNVPNVSYQALTDLQALLKNINLKNFLSASEVTIATTTLLTAVSNAMNNVSAFGRDLTAATAPGTLTPSAINAIVNKYGSVTYLVDCPITNGSTIYTVIQSFFNPINNVPNVTGQNLKDLQTLLNNSSLNNFLDSSERFTVKNLLIPQITIALNAAQEGGTTGGTVTTLTIDQQIVNAMTAASKITSLMTMCTSLSTIISKYKNNTIATPQILYYSIRWARFI